MTTTTELIVCTTCRPPGAPRDTLAAGEELLDAVRFAQMDEPMDEPTPSVTVRGVACLSGCSRACTVALQAPGKASYLFGDLSPDAETARQVLQCAAQHAATADGQLPRQARPERLRGGILARLPAPLPCSLPQPLSQP